MTLAEQILELDSIKKEEKEILGLETDVFNRYPGAIASSIADKGIVGWDGDARTTADGYPIHDGYGVVQNIKGKTIVWNQYASLISGSLPKVLEELPDANSVSVTYSDNTLTATVTGDAVTVKGFRWTKNIVRKHICLFVADAYKHTEDNVLCSIGAYLVGNGACTDQSQVFLRENDIWQRIYTRCVVDETVSYFGIRLSNAAIKDSYFSIKNLMFFDLTKMFGAGNEPTADEFFAMFPKEYYEKSSPVLLSVQGGNVTSSGKNLMRDEDADDLVKVGKWKKQEDGSYYGMTGNLNGTGKYYFTNCFKRAGIYTFSFDSVKDNTYSIYVGFNYTDGNSPSWYYTEKERHVVLTSEEGRIPKGIRFSYGNNAPATFSNLCLTYREEDIPYEPYIGDTSAIDPTTILDANGEQLFPFGLLSAGDVYDEITDGKAIKRIAAVDLGKQSWSKASPVSGDGYCFTSQYGFNCKGANSSDMANISCAKYAPDTRTNCLYSPINHDKIISFYTDKKIRIVDFSYDNATDFKDANADVYAYFELLEPIEVDIRPFKYKVYDNGEEVYTPRTLEPKPDIRVGYKYDIEKLDGTDIEY